MSSRARQIWSQISQFAHRNKTMLVCGITLELGFVLFLQTTMANDWTSLPYIFLAIFSIYIIAVWRTRNRMAHDSAALVAILVFAVAFRVTLFFSGPVFSFDIYRYIWDGKVAANGINPYLYRPNATELASLRDTNWGFVNHKELLTGYPPLMEMLFEGLYLGFESIWSYKFTFFLFDLATIAAICLILRELKLDLRNALLYAWAPLSIVEISQTGHNDSVAVFLVMLSFLLLLRNRNYLSAGIMGLAVVTKLYPIFFAPILFNRWGKWGTVAFLAIVFAFHTPYAGIGPLNIYSGLLYAINTSSFNASAFPLITSIIGSTDLTSNPGFAAQLVVYAIYLSLLLWALRNSLREKMGSLELIKTSFLLTGVVLLLDRSFFAWYMTWIIPFLAIYSSLSWLLMSGTVFFGYLKYNALPPPNFEAVGPITSLIINLIQYAPFYVIFAYELYAHKIRLWSQSVSRSFRREDKASVSTAALSA